MGGADGDVLAASEGVTDNEEMRFQAEWLEGRPIGHKLPSSIDHEITDTAPVMKNATKKFPYSSK